MSRILRHAAIVEFAEPRLTFSQTLRKVQPLDVVGLFAKFAKAMHPRTWREQSGLSQAEMAGRLSKAVGRLFSAHKVSRIEIGQAPDRATVQAYRRATAGAVQPADFFPDEQASPASPQPQEAAA